MVKASTVDRSDAKDIKKINDIHEIVHKLMFPEKYAKSILPKDEFSKKIAKLDNISKKFPKNYQKK